jgi:hypothetical protein
MTIRVAFRYNDPRIFARLVCFVRGGDSAHCEASDRWEQESHSCVSSSFLDHGVRRKLLVLAPDKWRIYEIQEPTETVADWYRKNAGKGYDLLGLLGFFVRRISGEPNKYFCSEAVASMLRLPNPWAYDLMLLESVCAKIGTRVQ